MKVETSNWSLNAAFLMAKPDLFLYLLIPVLPLLFLIRAFVLA